MKANLKKSVVPVSLRDKGVRMRIPSCHSTLSHRKEDVGQWSRWIGGGALVLALAGLLAPATTSAATCDDCNGEEVIEVEGEAPWTPPNYDGHDGSGGGGAGPSGEGGGGPSAGGGGGGGKPPSKTPRDKRIESEKFWCLDPLADNGTWEENVIFNDKGDTTKGKKLIGFSCTSRNLDPTGGLIYTRAYYDSQGYLNHVCTHTQHEERCTPVCIGKKCNLR